MNYLKRAGELYEQTVENRRYLHQIPEIGLELPETIDFIVKKLTEMGYEPKICGGGVMVCVGRAGGKTVLLRGDVDALPMKEKSGLPFASQKKMHIHADMIFTEQCF